MCTVPINKLSVVSFYYAPENCLSEDRPSNVRALANASQQPSPTVSSPGRRRGPGPAEEVGTGRNRFVDEMLS